MTAFLGSLSLDYPQGALDTSKWTRTIAFLGVLVIVSRVVKLVQGIKCVGSLPGVRIPLSPLSIPSNLLPVTWWNPNFVFIWKWRKNRNVYDHFGRDTVSFVPFLLGAPTLFTRSLEVGRQVLLGGLNAFDKPAFTTPYSYWGPNIIDAYGDQWRKHRKISTPAFNNDTYAAVWDASRKLFVEMVTAQDWASKDVVEVPSVNSVMFKFSLVVFTSVGFGEPLTWSNPPGLGDELSVQECLDIITKTIKLAMVVPSWAWKLPFEWIQRPRRAYDTMHAFVRSRTNKILRETIRSEAAEGVTKPGKDLFSLLIRASEDMGGKRSLSDDVLIGDVFSFLFAGHDSTAHALAATLALLALNFDIQEELVSHVREVTEGRGDDTLLHEDHNKLDKILAAYHEAIRMFPPGPIVPREAQRDIALDISDTNKPNMLVLKKGTQVVVDLVGLHYHPKYFPEPEVYRPSRWYAKRQDQSSDVKEGTADFVGFSFGPRACIGRKYSTTEAVCFLAHLFRDWRVEPLLAKRPNGQVESADEWRERVLQVGVILTLGIKDYGLRFVRRCDMK